ncbi:hypothetical protein [Rhodoblastus sp.]|uniref:hypothetical protein n=1 Tax=Rhodoblastus sp. TaxID=1962975 RepID=UPI0035AEBA2F
MRLVSLAAALALTLALAGCNANRPPPSIEATLPPPQDAARVTPRAGPDAGCADEIARYRAIQDNDFATGNVNKDVHAQIQTEIAEAERACAAGDQLRARYLLRASKERHGYPAG